jgi:general stress protein 26
MTDNSNAAELQQAFWKGIEKDRTVMLGCDGVYPRPMTALIEDGRGPVWFFTSADNDLAEAVSRGDKGAFLVFAAKDHDLFATASGNLAMDNDRAVIDRLWNPWIAAWFEGGKDDPTLRLLRFDPGNAEIWRNANSLWAGIKMLVGINPQKDYQDDVAVVPLANG